MWAELYSKFNCKTRVTWLTNGDQRTAILVTTLYFVFGLIVLRMVRLPKKAPNISSEL